MKDPYGNEIKVGVEVNGTPLPNQYLAGQPLGLLVVGGKVTRIHGDIVYVHTKDPQIEGSDTEIRCKSKDVTVITRTW